MRRIALISMLTLALIFLCITASQADVDFQMQKQLKLKDTPVDIKLAKSGRWLYVLMQNGQLRIYSQTGAFIGKLAVGEDIDQVEPGPIDEQIYLRSGSQKSVQVLEVIYNHAINIKGAPFKGSEDAPIVIVDYTDFECPYCARLLPTFQKLLLRFPGQIKIVYKNYPLRSHKFARKAASAAMAAHQKGKFWEFHDKLFANYHRMSDEVINDIRKEMKLDTAEFDALMQSPKIQRMIQQDVLQGQNIGVHSTPTVFVNGNMQKDKRLEGFIQTIEKELQRLKQ